MAHLKEFWGNRVRNRVNSEVKCPLPEAHRRFFDSSDWEKNMNLTTLTCHTILTLWCPVCSPHSRKSACRCVPPTGKSCSRQILPSLTTSGCHTSWARSWPRTDPRGTTPGWQNTEQTMAEFTLQGEDVKRLINKYKLINLFWSEKVSVSFCIIMEGVCVCVCVCVCVYTCVYVSLSLSLSSLSLSLCVNACTCIHVCALVRKTLYGFD